MKEDWKHSEEWTNRFNSGNSIRFQSKQKKMVGGRIRVLTLVLTQGSIVQCSPRDSKHQWVDTREVSTLVLHELHCFSRVWPQPLFAYE